MKILCLHKAFLNCDDENGNVHQCIHRGTKIGEKSNSKMKVYMIKTVFTSKAFSKVSPS